MGKQSGGNGGLVVVMFGVDSGVIVLIDDVIVIVVFVVCPLPIPSLPVASRVVLSLLPETLPNSSHYHP